MVSLCYTYKVEVNGVITETKTEKAFTQFPDMAEAKKWGRTKWKFLNWPDGKSRTSHKFTHNGKTYISEGWGAKKNMPHYISHYEMTMTEEIEGV